MRKISFHDIKPFLRYSRRLCDDIRIFSNEMVGYDSRLFYCIGGYGNISIGGIPYAISPHTLIFWRAGIPYRYDPSKENPMQFYAFNFDFTSDFAAVSVPIPPAPPTHFDASGITDGTLFSDAAAFNAPLLLNNAMELEHLFQKINEVYADRRGFYDLRCSGMLMDLLSRIAHMATNNYKSERHSHAVGDMIDYLQSHLESPLSNGDVGRHFGYHPNYINRLFVAETGLSLHAYLQNLRMQYAIQLLQETPLSVFEISRRCGFETLSHFSKMFKKATGYAPSVYKGSDVH